MSTRSFGFAGIAAGWIQLGMDWNTRQKKILIRSPWGGVKGEPLAKSLGQVTVFRCFLVQRLLSYDDPKSEPTVSLKLIH
jgi:hypothetical protein